MLDYNDVELYCNSTSLSHILIRFVINQSSVNTDPYCILCDHSNIYLIYIYIYIYILYEFCFKFYVSLKVNDVSINMANFKIDIFYQHCEFRLNHQKGHFNA